MNDIDSMPPKCHDCHYWEICEEPYICPTQNEKLEKKKMTNKEAIEMLKNKMDGSIDTSYSWCEAIRLAIQALEKTDYLNCEIPLDEYDLVNHYKNMDDQDKLIVAYLAKRFAETPLIKQASWLEVEDE